MHRSVVLMSWISHRLGQSSLQSNYELRLERRALRDKVAQITPLQVA